MNHQEKQEIFDQYALTQDFIYWNDLMHFMLSQRGVKEDIVKRINYNIFSACDLVQSEQQKRIAKKALIDVKVPGIEQWQGTFYSSPDVQIIVNKDSITNPENKIQ